MLVDGMDAICSYSNAPFLIKTFLVERLLFVLSNGIHSNNKAFLACFPMVLCIPAPSWVMLTIDL